MASCCEGHNVPIKILLFNTPEDCNIRISLLLELNGLDCSCTLQWFQERQTGLSFMVLLVTQIHCVMLNVNQRHF